jgi:hypothetical protein
MPQSQMKLDMKLPSFAAATEWLNRTTAEPRETETKGHPTLVHFWSLSSETSKINLAQVAQLRDQRKREGLRVVAIHLPQSEAEKDPRGVRDAVARLNVTEPCALDNRHRLRNAFLNGADDVPAYYLFDIDGNLRGSATGANGLDQIEDQLDQMLAIKMRCFVPNAVCR